MRSLVLLVEEADEEVRDGAQEDERLLGGHENAAEVLILDRREAPQAWGPLVVVVERRAGERQGKAEERREYEGGSEEREPLEGRGRVRGVRDHRPPEDEADREQDDVLDVQEPRVLERGVVERGEVDEVPTEEPDRERDAQSGYEREGPAAARGDRLAHRGRQTQHEQQRGQIGNDHVLEQMH